MGRRESRAAVHLQSSEPATLHQPLRTCQEPTIYQRREIDVLQSLRARALALIDAGDESKFEKLREVLEDPRYAADKWLVFSEHRDTVNFLVRRIEGLGYSDQVAVIHGGMARPERDEQVERFREPNGARFLVATDAAGEGINLQFCRLMVNYDIPWNPARLEQRMGRIHRYGQKHDVRVVNLVAGGTREGRVLTVLLDKLESVRRTLSSDKVFDVIGSLLENTSLREFMIDALTDEGEQRVLQRIERSVTEAAVNGIVERQVKVYGAAGEIAPRLSGMRQELDRERYLHLLPAYVRLFVESVADKLGIGIQGDLDGVFSLEPVIPGSLDALLPALEGYPSAVRDRLRIRRPRAGEACIWLHPGEPVFDALCSRVVDAFAHHARRGAIFIDPRADEAGLWHLAALSVEDDSTGVALAGESPNPIREAPRPVLEKRLLTLRQGADESVTESSLDALLALHCAPGVAPGSVPLASRGTALRADASVHVQRHASQLVETHRAARRAELPDRRRRVNVSFDLQSASLAKRRAELSRVAAPATERGWSEQFRPS